MNLRIKKIGVIFFMVFFNVMYSFAQYNDITISNKKSSFLGLETGLNYIVWNPYQDNNLKLQVGISYEYYISQRRSIRVKVKYFQVAKSADIVYYELLDGITQYNSDIIAIPVFYKWQFGKKKLTGYIFGGPYYAIELNAEYKNYEPEYEYIANDFGTYQGIGMQYTFNNSRILIYGDAELYKGTINKAPIELGDIFLCGLFVNKKLINLNLSVGVKFNI